MPDQPKTFYLTTPIYYVNARPHIGHAYTTIVADVLARKHRLSGDDTFFLTGTDEHGQKIERSAAAAGIPPQQFADQVSASFETLWARMGITNDAYIRTTSPAHARGVQKLFSTLYEKGFIYLASYTGAYCVSDETFVDAPIGTPCPDCGRLLEEVTEENFFFKLSQFQLPLLNLIESGQLSITPDSRKNEVLSFLRGNANDAYFDAIFEVSDDAPNREDKHQLALDQGKLKRSSQGNLYVPNALKDLSISRSSFTWGIPVPEPAASTAAQKHVIYVWLDALANYMTALGYGSGDETLFQKFWPANLHLVGKEIIRFHCVYWPAFLLAADLALPKAITAHGWLLFDNSKMSKSKGNIVRTETVLDTLGTLCPPPLSTLPNSVILSEGAEQHPAPQSKDLHDTRPATVADPHSTGSPNQANRDLFAADILRYFLLREIPFGQDGTFSFDALITRYNADLANGYGNLVSRTLSMIQKYFDGSIPSPRFLDIGTNSIEPDGFDSAYVGKAAFDLRNRLQGLPETDLTTTLAEVAAFVTVVDGFISSAAPWKLAKDPTKSDRLATVLYIAAEAIRWITAILHPFCPYVTGLVWTQAGLGDIADSAQNGELAHLIWGGLQPGTRLGPLAPIFPRADKGLAQIMTDIENPTNSQLLPGQNPAQSSNTSALTAEQKTLSTDPAAPPRSLDEPSGTLPVAGSHAHTTGPSTLPSHTEAHASGIFANQQPATDNQQTTITIDDFAKIDLRVAQIILAERIPKADKLLRLEVDLGPLGQRQILSGIAEFYTPEELTGRRIVVITNLAPRKMRGFESHGMLLAASDPEAGDHGKPHLATCGDDIPLGSRLK